MVVQGSLGESVYTVGSAVFPVLNVNEDEVREVFREKERKRAIVQLLQKGAYDRGKAFVDVKYGASAHKLSCRAAAEQNSPLARGTLFRDHLPHRTLYLVVFFNS